MTFSISIAVGILLANIEIIAYSSKYYRGEFSSLGVYSEFERRGISNSELDEYATRIILFLRGMGELPEGLLNQDEEAHMEDVRALFSLSRRVLILSGMIAAISVSTIILISGQDACFEIARSLRKASTIFLVILILGSAALMHPSGFEMAFIGFHRIFFPRGNWTFPEGSIITSLFPERFFQRAALRITLMSALEMAVFVLISPRMCHIFRRRKRRKL